MMRNDKPKVSIIIPIYNTEKYIRHSIESVINQDYTNFEVILVDDGSTDNGLEIANNMLKASHVDYKSILHEKNMGQYAARNTGVTNACGEYIIFLDSDDVLARNCITAEIEMALQHNVNMVFSDFQMVDVDRIQSPPLYNDGCEIIIQNEAQIQFLLRTIKILAPGTIYNLEWYKECNLKFENVPYGEDVLFLWKTLQNVDRVVHIKSPLYNYFHRPNSIMTSTKYQKIIESIPYYEKLAIEYKEDKKAAPLVQKYLYSRYIFSILHSGARICTFVEYKEIITSIEYRKCLKALLDFPDRKIRLLSALGIVSERMLYCVFKYS